MRLAAPPLAPPLHSARLRQKKAGNVAAILVAMEAEAQRLKAAFHYTVACLCQEVAEDKNIQFSKHSIAAISEISFRQCEIFAKDLEMFANHGKRSTINAEDVKLLARRSNSLLKYITQKSDKLSLNNLEEKEKRKKKSAAKKGGRNSNELEEPAAIEDEDSNMA